MRTLIGQGIPNINPPSSSYPYGRAKNSNPPSTRNGTPIQEENLLTDIPYALLAVMKYAGIIPDDLPENINDSQFLQAILALIGETGKVIVDAPDLDSSNLNLLCRYSSGLGSADFNTWVGVCESVGKLTVQGVVKLKIRNRTAAPVLATAGTNVFAGDSGFYSAGFIQTTPSNNSDLTKTNNIVGEIAEDFLFTDTISYFEVNVVIKGKPMIPIDTGGFWTEDATAQTLEPDQSGIAIEPISSQWDPAKIKDKNRVVYEEDAVVFHDFASKTLYTYINMALNNLSQLVSTNALPGVLLKSGNGNFGISLYSPTAGAGSVVTEDVSWLFDKDGVLLSNAAIVLGERSTGVVINGEMWYDSGLDKFISRELGIDYEINNHNSKDNLQGGTTYERFHLTQEQYNAAIKWIYSAEIVGVHTENVYLNQNWLGVGDPVQNNWNPNLIGIELGFRHGLVDSLTKLLFTSQMFIDLGGAKRRSAGSGDYYGWEIELDGELGKYNLRRSTQPESVEGTAFSMENLMQIDRDEVKIPSALIVGDRVSGTRKNGELWYDDSAAKLKGRENNEDYNLINLESNLSLQYRFSTTTTAPPSSGQLRLNNATQGSSTIAWFNDSTSGGVNVANLLSNMDIGTVFYIFDESNTSNFQKWQITGLTDLSGYTEFDITLLATSGISFSNNQKLIVHFTGGGSGGGGGTGIMYLMDAENSGSQVISSTLPTKVNYATENIDEGNNYNPVISTWANGSTHARGTVTARVYVTTAAGGVVTAFIYQNGVVVAGSSVEVTTANSFYITTAATVDIAAFDTFEVFLQQSTGFALTIQNSEASRFTVFKTNDPV